MKNFKNKLDYLPKLIWIFIKMSSTKYCSITAGKNICGICWNECCFDPVNPVKAKVKELDMMQLFLCGHAVCTPCFYKMLGFKLCICNRLALFNCQDCELNLCNSCACLHDNNHKDDVFVFENNHENDSYWQGRSWKKVIHDIIPFTCPFCRDCGSSFSNGFGSYQNHYHPSNTLSQWLYEFCGNSTSGISSLVKGYCTHDYLVMLREIKKVDDENKRIEAAKLKKAEQTAKYLSLKASMSISHTQMVKDRKEQEDAKKPKLCDSSRLRKTSTPLYTERIRNKTHGRGKTNGKTKGKTKGNLYKMDITKKRIEKRLEKLRTSERCKEMKDSAHELRRITGKMRRIK